MLDSWEESGQRKVASRLLVLDAPQVKVSLISSIFYFFFCFVIIVSSSLNSSHTFSGQLRNKIEKGPQLDIRRKAVQMWLHEMSAVRDRWLLRIRLKETRALGAIGVEKTLNQLKDVTHPCLGIMFLPVNGVDFSRVSSTFSQELVQEPKQSSFSMNEDPELLALSTRQPMPAPIWLAQHNR